MACDVFWYFGVAGAYRVIKLKVMRESYIRSAISFLMSIAGMHSVCR